MMHQLAMQALHFTYTVRQRAFMVSTLKPPRRGGAMLAGQSIHCTVSEDADASQWLAEDVVSHLKDVDQCAHRSKATRNLNRARR
ncbi:hypothetical protein [Xanthomonas euvesicatoria]|uniref:hypothetical protein n=1 Tax=Xanthomonas euvesicatoria TaxID=456327 RepID=UPI001C452509|nr:hypothetical protein [Xanthomonas euvesicatoria]MBV6807972.1 hypothetical protein [Xanthomonas campestris pv. convolvuli]